MEFWDNLAFVTHPKHEFVESLAELSRRWVQQRRYNIFRDRDQLLTVVRRFKCSRNTNTDFKDLSVANDLIQFLEKNQIVTAVVPQNVAVAPEYPVKSVENELVAPPFPVEAVPKVAVAQLSPVVPVTNEMDPPRSLAVAVPKVAVAHIFPVENVTNEVDASQSLAEAVPKIAVAHLSSVKSVTNGVFEPVSADQTIPSLADKARSPVKVASPLQQHYTRKRARESVDEPLTKTAFKAKLKQNDKPVKARHSGILLRSMT